MANENDPTDIKTKDITNPKNLARKSFSGLLSGVGGVGQEMTKQFIKDKIPFIKNPALIAFIEWLVVGIANGLIPKKMEVVSNILDGWSAGSAKDLTKSLWDMIKGMKSPIAANAESPQISTTGQESVVVLPDAEKGGIF